MEVSLFFLVPSVQLGGCTSYTVHLVLAMRAMGLTPRLYRIGKRPGSRSFGYGLTIETIAPPTAFALARRAPSLIVYCFWRKQGAHARTLLEAGVPMVVHDPAEFRKEWVGFARARSVRTLVIREQNVVGLRELGVSSTYVPHPYVASGVKAPGIKMHAVSAVRVDFRKRTHVIVEANRTLPPERQVWLYGEVNRMYAYHYLRERFPEWGRWYRGEFPAERGAAVKLNGSARFAIDLTEIKGDGGGTQYSFFEAWEAGTPLLLNANWFVGNDEVAGAGIPVASAHDIVSILSREPAEFQSFVEQGKRVMQAHSPEAVVPRYLEVLCA